MIKLIAADMDGTLLDSQRRLPPDFIPVLDALTERGIIFAAASGRQYYNLRRLLHEVADRIAFVCENGAMVFYQGVNIHRSPIALEKLAAPLAAVRGLENPGAIFCGVDAAWMEWRNERFLSDVAMYYERRESVSDLMAVPDDICKLAVFHPEDAEKFALPALRQFGDDFLISVSGKNWIDFMNPGTNKGSAIRKLQSMFNISEDETMAFGDFLNDLEMMDCCGHSYAMANSHPELAAVCRFRAPSNDENGVMRVIRETVLAGR